MDAAEKNHVGIGLRGLVTQAQRIAHEIGDFLQLGHLVVVRQNDSLALSGQLAELFRQIKASPARTATPPRKGIYSRGYHKLLSWKPMTSQMPHVVIPSGAIDLTFEAHVTRSTLHDQSITL